MRRIERGQRRQIDIVDDLHVGVFSTIGHAQQLLLGERRLGVLLVLCGCVSENHFFDVSTVESCVVSRRNDAGDRGHGLRAERAR